MKPWERDWDPPAKMPWEREWPAPEQPAVEPTVQQPQPGPMRDLGKWLFRRDPTADDRARAEAVNGFVNLTLGLATGSENFAGGLKQRGLQAAEMLGAVPTGTSADFTRQEEGRRRLIQDVSQHGQNSVVLQSLEEQNPAFSVGQLFMENAPYVAVPGVMGAGAAARAASIPVLGALQGAAAFTPEEGSLALQMLSGAGITSGLAGTGYAGGVLLRHIFSGPKAGEVVKDFALGTGQARLTPTAGQLGGHIASEVESHFMQIAWAQRRLKKTLDAQANALGNRVERLADSLGSPLDEAGQFLQAGLYKKKSAIEDVGKRFWEQFDNVMPPEHPVALDRTIQVLDDLLAEIPGAQNLSKGALAPPSEIRNLQKHLMADVGSNTAGMLPFQAVKEIRNRVSESINWTPFEQTRVDAMNKRIWAALKDDMRSAAKAVSNDAAPGSAGKKASYWFKRADRYHRAVQKRLEGSVIIQDNVIKTFPGIKKWLTQADPDAMFNHFFTKSKTGPSALRVLKRSLMKAAPDGKTSHELWESATANLIRRMGRETPGQGADVSAQWSTRKFLTNWRAMDESAKKEWFSGFRHQGVRESLDTVAEAVSGVEKQIATLDNTSRTARGLASAMAILGPAALVWHGQYEMAGSVVAALVTARVGAEAFSDPRFVRWLADTTKVGSNKLPQQIVKATALSQGLSPESQQALQETLREMAQGVQGNQ